MRVITPLRIYIVFVIILTIAFFLSPLNSKDNWGFGIFLIPLYTLIPAIILEIVLTIIRRKIPVSVFLILSIVGVLISMFGTVKYFFWVSNVKTEIHLPSNYSKDYVLVIYGISNQPELTTRIGLQKTRKINVPQNGTYLTSTKYENSDLVMLIFPEVYDSSGELLKMNNYDEHRQRFTFPCLKGRYDKTHYYIISISKKKYNHSQADSILQASKILNPGN